MNRRLREPAERPLDPGTGRIVVILAGAVCIGFAVLVGLGLHGPQTTGSPPPVAKPPHASVPAVSAPPRRASVPDRPTGSADRPAQDPQDRIGSPAARRADRELAAHRALQHVPWHRRGVWIRMIGARNGRAVLSVVGPGIGVDRRGWRIFLDAFHDAGRAYLPRFTTRRAG